MPLPSDNDLIFRTTDATKWGTGKGSPLTSAEVDLNFWELLDLIADLAANAAVPATIDDIAVSNGQITFTLSDAQVFGPFDLPQQAFRWAEEFVGAADYLKFDVFTANNNLYLVLQAHTAASVFDPAATNMSGPLYGLMIAGYKLYDIGFFWPGFVGLGLEADECMFSHQFARAAYLPEDLVDSVAGFEVDPLDGLFEVGIFKNATLIGSFTFDPSASSGEEALFTFAAGVQFAAGDKLRVIRPASGSSTTLDSAAKGFTMTLAAVRGTL